MKYKYKIVGYEKEEKVMRQLISAVAVWVIAKDAGKALDEAKKMIKKKHYQVAEVHEILENSQLKEHNQQNLLHQRYRKRMDAEILKENRKSNKILERIAGAIERVGG